MVDNMALNDMINNMVKIKMDAVANRIRLIEKEKEKNMTEDEKKENQDRTKKEIDKLMRITDESIKEVLASTEYPPKFKG